MSRLSPADPGDVTGSRRRGVARRLGAVVATAALCTAALPLTGAYAATSASATLTAGTKVFPGLNSFTIDVANTGTAVLGSAVNYVDIALPNTIGIATTADKVTPPPGWSVTRTSLGGLQTYTFRGGSIATGQDQPFNFPASVAAPVADRTGSFQVAVSSDNGKSTSGANGALATTVQTLQIKPGTLQPTGDPRVTDGTGTAGQTVTFGYTVHNYAKAAQTVTTTLTGQGGDMVTQPAPTSVPAGGDTTFSAPVVLGGSTDRTDTLAAAATADPSKADPVSTTYTVQKPVAIITDFTSFTPTAVRPNVPTTFNVALTDTGTPAVSSFATATLTIGGQSTGLASPATLAPGTKTTGSFQPVALALSDGRYDVTTTFTGTDANGFGFSSSASSQNLLTVDGTLPVLKATATLPSGQTAATNGNAISYSVNVDDCSPISTVALVTDQGQTYNADLSAAQKTTSGSGCTYTGSITLGGSGSAALSPATRAFFLKATATDAAGNVGTDNTPKLPVDLVAPAFTRAKTLGTTATNKILVHFEEPADINGVSKVYGACDPSQWKIDGELLVSQVTYSDGSSCTRGAAGPDNDRILVLTQSRSQDLQTNVTYTPGASPLADPARDGAALQAAMAAVATTVGTIPAAPSILKVTRNNGAEAAYSDGKGTYWTRFGGNDLQVTFSGAAAGYYLRITDGAGKPVAPDTAVSTSPATVSVPLPGTASDHSTDGTYMRQLLLINTGGQASVPTKVSIVLDTVLPTLAKTTKVDSKTLTVDFSEPLAAGTDYAEDWYAYQSNPNADPTDPTTTYAYYQVSSVNPVAGQPAERTITTTNPFAYDTAPGALYNLRNPDGVRYSDYAGNTLANTGGL